MKSRTFKARHRVRFNSTDIFDWLAIVILQGGGSRTKRQIFIIPRELADEKCRRIDSTAKTAATRYWWLDEVPVLFAAFENNFTLHHSGTVDDAPTVELDDEEDNP